MRVVSSASNASGADCKEPEASQRDPLTGFFSQSYLDGRLNKLLSNNRVQPQQAVLALIQLENFFEVRTWIGKAEANLLLGDLARLVLRSLPPNVIIARCDKYEFAALLWGSASKQARRITNDIKSLIQKTSLLMSPRQIELRCGIGLADIDRHSAHRDVMYARARHAMSQSASNSRRGRESCQPSDERKLLKALHTALRNKALETNYQALLSTGLDQLEYYEVRAELGPAREAISSQQLVEVAAKYGLAEALDRQLITRCLELLVSANNNALRLMVSLTHNSIVSGRFFPWLKSTVRAFPSVKNQLLFQVSEIDVLIAQHHTDAFCAQLDALDCQLCINHFGCTDNPFRYLDLLRARMVKLDASLVDKQLASSEPEQNLSALIEKLHDRGLRVAVGMIDEVSLLPALWRSQVNFVQGYCLHRPSPRLDYEHSQELVLSGA